jgi:hypothetical protein
MKRITLKNERGYWTRPLNKRELQARARALDFSDRVRPGADQFNGGGPLLPHAADKR